LTRHQAQITKIPVLAGCISKNVLVFHIIQQLIRTFDCVKNANEHGVALLVHNAWVML
jgi:hypothetical protein